MTPAEELAEVRARLERMVALAKAIPCHEQWTPSWISYNRRDVVPDYTFIAAASPDLLLRVAREALHVLDRHGADCIDCGVFDRCSEVDGVLRAWKP